MAATTHWYTTGVKNLMSGATNGVWDWDTDTIKCSLHTSSYAVNQNTDAFYNAVTNEVSSTNYTAGGNTLASPTLTVVSNVVQIDAADTTWTTVSFTARYAVIYKSTGTASTSPLIAYIDFGADQTVSAGNFTIQFAATGVLTATAS
jgi:hypothetical protein